MTVLRKGEDYVSPKGRHADRWLCECECGGAKLVQTATLRHGNCKSCGCLQKELATKRLLKQIEDNATNLVGQEFGRLTVVEKIGSIGNRGIVWRCVCCCGNETTVPTRDLRSGNTKSCGCLRNEKISRINLQHGESHTRLYNVWVGMRQRCNDPNHKSYHNYGGRGIHVCPEWDSYSTFKEWAILSGYRDDAAYSDCTFDRKDVNGDYSPENCQWADALQQAANKRVSSQRQETKQRM